MSKNILANLENNVVVMSMLIERIISLAAKADSSADDFGFGDIEFVELMKKRVHGGSIMISSLHGQISAKKYYRQWYRKWPQILKVGFAQPSTLEVEQKRANKNLEQEIGRLNSLREKINFLMKQTQKLKGDVLKHARTLSKQSNDVYSNDFLLAGKLRGFACTLMIAKRNMSILVTNIDEIIETLPSVSAYAMFDHNSLDSLIDKKTYCTTNQQEKQQ